MINIEKKIIFPKNVIFFGASVTQQTFGYATPLFNKIKEYSRDKNELFRYGYGGLHLAEATLLLDRFIIPKLKVEEQNICFMEWFTSGCYYSKEDFIKYLDYIITRLTSFNVKIVFLYLYNNNNIELREKYLTYYEEIANFYNISSINIFKWIKDSKLYPSLFRDNVHNTENGGKIIADKIFELLLIYGIKEIKSQIIKDNDCFNIITKNINIKNKDLYIYQDMIVYILSDKDNIIIKDSGKLKAIWVMTDLDAGIVNIENEEGNIIKVNIWDIWSHYPRFKIIGGLDFNFKSFLKIYLDNSSPDYNTCTREILNKDTICKKLKIIAFSFIPLYL